MALAVDEPERIRRLNDAQFCPTVLIADARKGLWRAICCSVVARCTEFLGWPSILIFFTYSGEEKLVEGVDAAKTHAVGWLGNLAIPFLLKRVN